MNTNIPHLLGAVRLCSPCRAPKQPVWKAVSSSVYCQFDCCFIQQFLSTTPLAKLTRNPEKSLFDCCVASCDLVESLWIFSVRLTVSGVCDIIRCIHHIILCNSSFESSVLHLFIFVTISSVICLFKRSLVTSATLPHSTLTKRHNILAFHRVREAIATKLMAFYWIQSAYNLIDMLSKHWDHPTVYPMILKLLITRGNITLIPKEATPRKRKRKFKITTRKIEKERKRRIKITKNMINTPTTRGE